MSENKKRDGWTWKQIGKGENDGYWSKVDSTSKHSHKLSFFCPRKECRRITSTVDDKYLLEYGVCSECYVKLIEDRKEPLIDIEFYKKRYKERGY